MQESNSETNHQTSHRTRDVIGECEAIKAICRQIRQIAPTPCTVLISGETGTGKSLFAEQIFELSDRADSPFVYMNCATPPETTAEAEIFGYHKKTLTGYSQPSLEHLNSLNGGTLLIDEISELPADGQAHFLEVLEILEKQNTNPEQPSLDIRLIVTTQNDPRQLLQKNKFNKRLFYHLNVFSIEIPALRDRGADKIKLAESALKKANSKYQKSVAGFTSDAINAINNYDWPGNYRELSNSIERAVVMSDAGIVNAELMQLDKEIQPPANKTNNHIDNKMGLAEPTQTEPNQDLSLEDYFQHFVLEHQDQMTETELAHKLGVSRKCLWERRQKLGIPKRKSAARSD